MKKTTSLLTMIALALVAAGGCASKPRTYTGVVTTMMCGNVHFAGLTPADCVRKCVKDGSQYALMVGDTLYKLDGNVAGLDTYAAQTVRVFGSARRKTIHVTSISSP